jgi:hypothetical protein
VMENGSSSTQTAQQTQHNQHQHGEQHDKNHSSLEFVRLPPFKLLRRGHGESFDAVQQSTKHGRSAGRDDVGRIRTASGCTLKQTEHWSDAEDRLPESSKRPLHESQ